MIEKPLHLETSINGERVEWPREIWQKWYTHVERLDPKFYDTEGVATEANYFTPRPWTSQYDQGDRKEGFTITVGRGTSSRVIQVVINGLLPFTSYPQPRPR